MGDMTVTDARVRRTCADVKPGEALVECECGAVRPHDKPHGWLDPTLPPPEPRELAGTFVSAADDGTARVETPGERDRRRIAALIKAIEVAQRDIVNVVAAMRLNGETTPDENAERIIALCDAVTNLGVAATEARHGA